MKQARQGLTAPILRLILSGCLVLIALSAVGIAYLANDQLQTYTNGIRRTIIDSKGSNQNNDNIDTLERQLKTHKDTVSRAAQIVADSQSYKYQNEIIRDIKAYAEASKVDIASITFIAETTPTNSNQSSTTQKAPSINGVKPTTVAVALAREVSYADALGFIHAIEQNLTKMQISSLGLSAPKVGMPSNSVRIDTINLEVYLKQ